MSVACRHPLATAERKKEVLLAKIRSQIDIYPSNPLYPSMNEDQIRFEAQLTFLEKTVTELSDELYRQQRATEKLQRDFDKLKSKFDSLEDTGGNLPHVPPPHF